MRSCNTHASCYKSKVKGEAKKSAVLQFILYGPLTDIFPFIECGWLRSEGCCKLKLFYIEVHKGLRLWIVQHNKREQGDNNVVKFYLSIYNVI